jgi:hypothetical protein
MKILKYSTFSALLASLFLVFACEKVASPLPTFETAVHALGKLTTASFAIANTAAPAAYKWRWVSIDGKNTVSKVEYFVTLTEAYDDKEGNARVANHGTKAWKVIEGSAIGANRTDIDGSITQADVYGLFKDAAFDYGKGGGKVNVFTQNGRTATNRFIKNDGISITWFIYTADGRKFTEWSPAVCESLLDGTGAPLANCSMNISVK